MMKRLRASSIPARGTPGRSSYDCLSGFEILPHGQAFGPAAARSAARRSLRLSRLDCTANKLKFELQRAETVLGVPKI